MIELLTRRRALRDERGSSLLEMMATLLLLGICSVVIFQGIVSTENATAGAGARLQNLDQARVLMDTVSKDLRTAVRLSAGTSPFTNADATDAVFYANLDTTAAPKKVHIYIDADHRLIEQVWNPDPGTVAPNYTYNTTSPTTRLVGSFVANTAAQPIFTFIDSDGNNLGPTPLSASDLLAIKSVSITLIVYKSNPWQKNATTLLNRVRLPNVDYNAVAS
jgi:type II secretory pathway pseudopilin PulG